MRDRLCLLALLVALLPALGCSREPRSYRVSGTVTLDNEPVPDGDIHFLDVNGHWGAEPGKIKDGRYELMAKAGPKRVEISASRIIRGGARGAGGEAVPEEYIPEEYNVKSWLRAEVTEGGENEFHFQLKGQQKR